ncbi:GW dipeptide domain-containing protein [Pedobacter sp. Hv1]|uniref:GW dipeptide domain-containing protein n=1 Tax=Pedobacter sp. Hv1 TaxID=1740090 RepID=UPI0006D8989A|nr:GW dipeptide domain-containing protein [Pedobacter sp. Hv1]KQC00152.1 hypothetical protein AQF98_11645 [Pedobacter sp. Hv1]
MNIICKKERQHLFILSFAFLLLLLGSCQTEKAIESNEYFLAKIDDQLWQSVPAQTFKKYNVSYKALSHQLSILAEAKDGTRIEISFHDVGALKVGNYPSTINDEGVQSGIFYAPERKTGGKEMSSVTYDIPVQENTVQLTKLDKTDRKAYVIEGNFSSTLYALHQSNPKRTSVLTGGKFRVIYYPDLYNPEF